MMVMRNNFFKATFAAMCFILAIACQKEMNDKSLSRHVQTDARVTQPGAPWQLVPAEGQSLGSTIGPGGDLFVPNGVAGTISRIDPKTGTRTTFASGLPQLLAPVGIGGITDVAFIGSTAYALVTLVDDPVLFPTGQVNGIYRIDGPTSFTVIADIGAYNLANPPTGFSFFVSTGVSYSIQTYRGGFLVTDGHLNRVLHVTLDGNITVVQRFRDIVPTGLAVHGNDIYLSEAGPVPHLPENGKVVKFSGTSAVSTVASGASLIVDVEFGRGQTLFALSQGPGVPGAPDGSPAQPNTGSLLRVNGDGTFTVLADEIDRPTSMEIIGNSAYIVTLSGAIWVVDNIVSAPFGRQH
jgi:hypothetical protein